MDLQNTIYLINNEICTKTPCLKPNTLIVYDVIRIIDKKPLFFYLHFDNLTKALNKFFNFGIEISSLKQQIKKLIELTNTTKGNVKIEIFNKNETIQTVLHFVPHYYPTPDQYDKGVTLNYMKAERKTPQLKTWQTNIRNNANEIKSKTNSFEVLLLNDENQITEGSRSNILFIQNNTIISPPSNLLLQGVTRKVLLNIISENDKLNYKESKVYYKHIKKFEAAFLTGTSLNILPVAKINDWNFNANNTIIKQLISSFKIEVEYDINSFKYD